MMRILFFLLILMSCKPNTKETIATHDSTPKLVNAVPQYAMVIHGGAGTILKKNMTLEKESAYEEALTSVLQIGKKVLSNGGTSHQAVVETISYMENSPLFNAGKGAVFAHNGMNEMDASIMTGKDLNAGAVGGVTTVKNPITAALAVLEKSDHVLMVGSGAEEFAEKQGCEMAPSSYFKTDNRWESLKRAKEKAASLGSANNKSMSDYKFGTVGAVALDMDGHITAGTSTGGMTNKKYNRIGDSPIIGAGTYANDNTCGVSCTGHGEYFIRYAVAHDLSACMDYQNKGVDEAARWIIHKKLKEAGGSGGLVALDKKGNITMPFNTKGMYRGYVTDKTIFTAIYEEE